MIHSSVMFSYQTGKAKGAITKVYISSLLDWTKKCPLMHPSYFCTDSWPVGFPLWALAWQVYCELSYPVPWPLCNHVTHKVNVPLPTCCILWKCWIVKGRENGQATGCNSSALLREHHSGEGLPWHMRSMDSFSMLLNRPAYKHYGYPFLYFYLLSVKI